MFLGVRTKVHGCPMIGNSGMEFSGKRVSSFAVCSLNAGQLVRLELAWLEEVPHDTQDTSFGVVVTSKL